MGLLQALPPSNLFGKKLYVIYEISTLFISLIYFDSKIQHQPNYDCNARITVYEHVDRILATPSPSLYSKWKETGEQELGRKNRKEFFGVKQWKNREPEKKLAKQINKNRRWVWKELFLCKMDKKKFGRNVVRTAQNFYRNIKSDGGTI